VTEGDPTYAGPLAGISLGLPVFHVLEAAVKAGAQPEVYEAQVGLMEGVLEADGIIEAVQKVRDQPNA
jgi:glycine/sarcosine/betaine reductase complex component A